MLTSIVPTVDNILKIGCYDKNHWIGAGQNHDLNVGKVFFRECTDGFHKDGLSCSHIDSLEKNKNRVPISKLRFFDESLTQYSHGNAHD